MPLLRFRSRFVRAHLGEVCTTGSKSGPHIGTFGPPDCPIWYPQCLTWNELGKVEEGPRAVEEVSCPRGRSGVFVFVGLAKTHMETHRPIVQRGEELRREPMQICVYLHARAGPDARPRREKTHIRIGLVVRVGLTGRRMTARFRTLRCNGGDFGELGGSYTSAEWREARGGEPAAPAIRTLLPPAVRHRHPQGGPPLPRIPVCKDRSGLAFHSWNGGCSWLDNE